MNPKLFEKTRTEHRGILKREIEDFENQIEAIEAAVNDDSWKYAGMTVKDGFGALMYRTEIFLARIKVLI